MTGELSLGQPIQWEKYEAACLPESLPDRPSLEARPQKVEQEYRESNDVAVDEVNHNQR